jgi:hypothetical protein
MAKTQGRRDMATTRHAIKHGYRSGLEETIAKDLKEAGISFLYEDKKITYQVNQVRTYTPDFILPNGIIIETKGRFVVDDRMKHLMIREQYPHLDLRFVFSNSRNKIRKGSKTTYGDWCTKHGFLYADKRIPDEWLKQQ